MIDINTVLNDATWVGRSQPVDDLTPRFAFRLNRTVYVGDPNSGEQYGMALYNPPIALPDLDARDPLAPLSHEVLGREAALADYYRQIMEKTGRKPDADAVGYWLSLVFVSETCGQLGISFPWWDRVADASGLFEWLRTAEVGGPGFFDCDQGWFFKAERTADRFHFQQGVLDTGEVLASLNTGREAFLERLAWTERDVMTVIQRLKAQLGIDPWS